MEGPDDLHVVRHLRQYHHPVPGFDIVEKGGFDELAASIPVEVKVPGRIALGIVVDADEDREARWRSITGRLLSAGIQAPRAIEPSGTIIEGSPRVGIWLMPDNQSEGELEDFVAGLVPDSDPVWPLATTYIRDIPPKDRKFKQKKELESDTRRMVGDTGGSKANGAGHHVTRSGREPTTCARFRRVAQANLQLKRVQRQRSNLGVVHETEGSSRRVDAGRCGGRLRLQSAITR